MKRLQLALTQSAFTTLVNQRLARSTKQLCVTTGELYVSLKANWRYA